MMNGKNQIKALQYAIEALCDLDVHCTTEEEREELNEVIQILESMKGGQELRMVIRKIA